MKITEENGTSVAGRRVNGLASSGDKAKYGSDELYTGANNVARADTAIRIFAFISESSFPR